MLPRKHLFVFILFVLLNFAHPQSLSVENVSFNFQSFTTQNFTLFGDSYLRDGVIGLTNEHGVPSSSSGAVFYNHPIAFYDPASKTTASFSTRFSFSIDNINPASFGDGFTFFLSPENRPRQSPGLGGYLGLLDSAFFTGNKFLAVEFDTKLDLYFNDPSDNHIGLDIDGLDSIKTADPIWKGINLKGGNVITAWIDYKNDKKTLFVFLSYAGFKPEDPTLTVDIDLCDYLKGIRYVGFSSSTEGSTETHLILNWSFQTFGFRHSRPRSRPHNVSVNSVTQLPSTQESNSTHKTHNKLGIFLGITGPTFLGIVLVLFGWISVKKWRGIRVGKSSFRAEMVAAPREFSYRQLKEATKGFHSSMIIGDGAFGTVYKAFLVDLGIIAAVKMSKHTHEGKAEFFAELSIIASLRHKNLVQLLGWCVKKGEILLVYEFMPNNSLDTVLYQESESGNPLKWLNRYNIAVGLASVLTYLHQECVQQVIHRDVKTSNIMLDVNLNARLGDFGLARLMDHNRSPVSTLTVGTMGYLAPEYLQFGKVTEKTDVFSYGVVVLELACGRRPIVREPGVHGMVNLVDWVWGLHSQGKIMEAVDKRLNNGEFDVEEMRKLLLIGLSCASPDFTERPSMRRVFQILNNEAEPMDVPQFKPSLTFCDGFPSNLGHTVADDEESKDA